MKTLFTTILILALFCSGFTWGKSKEESCWEAKELVFGQQLKNPDVVPNDLERSVNKLCPGGAAQKYIEGLKSELGNQVDQAMLQYKSVIKIDDHFSYAHGRMGLLQLKQNNKPAAMVSLTKALEEGGKNPLYHLALAQLLLETQAYPLALYHYEKSHANGRPYDADFLAGMAQASAGMKNWKEAESLYLNAILLSPDDWKLKAELARTVIHQQRLVEGIKLLKTAIALKPDDKPLHRDLADALNAFGEAEAANTELKLAGVVVPSEYDTLVQQGDVHFVHRDFPAAIRNYKIAAEKKANPQIFQKLGDAYLAVGNDDEALGSYQKSLFISPDDADVHYSIGVILERKGDIGRAVSEYERSTLLDTNNGDAHRRLAEIYALKGELQKAIAEYKIIVQKAPDNPVLHFRLAKVYQRSGNNDEAKQSLEMAVKLDPKNLEARRELIKHDIKHKDLVNAEIECRKILNINRDDEQERKRLIGILGQQKKYNDVIVFLSEEIIRYPKDSVNFYRLGIVKEHLKDYRGAIQAFLKSIEIKPTVQSYQALARAYLSIFETNKAREALTEASRLDPKKKDSKELIEIINEELGHTNSDNPKRSSVKMIDNGHGDQKKK